MLWLSLTMLLGSAASMALEIVAGRMLAPYVGMSLYTWTAIIAVVLAGLSAGHWLGGWLTDRTSNHALCAGAALGTAAVTCGFSQFALQTAAARALPSLEAIQGIGALALAAFFLPSLAAGILSPVLTRMALDRTESDHRGRVLGRMFALGALGAILGTLGSGFWLISWIGSHGSVMLVAGVYALLSVPFLTRRWALAPVALALLLAAAGVLGPGRIDALTSPCRVESDYYCIRIDDYPEPGHEARVMALDHLAHGINDRHDPGLILSPYVHLVDEMLRLRLPGEATEGFFVGGGAYTLPRAWAARLPQGRFTVAEIDPAVTRAAADWMWLDPSPLEILHLDARAALATLPPERRFDVIFGDAFHDISIPAHLVTDQFHALVKSRLKPDGFYALNVVEALREPPFLLSLVRTLMTRFTSVELWLDADALQPTEARVTWIVIASDGPTGRDRIDAQAGPTRTWLRVPTEAMLAVLPERRTVFLTDDFAPVDRLMSHVLLERRLSE
jgi:MFS family permease